MAETTKQLSSNLDAISAKVRKLTAEMKKLQRGSDEYKTKQKALNVELQKGEKQAEKLAVKMQGLNTKNKNHAGSVDAGTQAQKRWNATAAKGGAIAKTSGSAIGRMGKRMRTLGTYLLASAGLAAAVAALNEIFINSAKRAIALEKAIADVGAVAGLTEQELKKIRNTAFDVAGATSLTAIEVTKLQKELAKLGLSADEIQDLSKPVALLSQALGESGEVTAQTLQKIQNQFVLTSETATQTANALVGAVNESALNMNDLATGLQYVGPLALQAGQSFSETAAQLGVLADNGFKASRAGTGLRTVLIEAAKTGKPVNVLLRDLAESGLSVARATELFTKRGAAAAIVLAQQYDAVDELNDQLQESDRLFQANAKQMGTTRGQVDLLRSAYDKASTSLGEWITKTDFFISLTYNLDKEAGAQAAAYRFIANNAQSSADAIENLIDAQRAYEKGGASELNIVRTAFRTIAGEVETTEDEFITLFQEQRRFYGSTEETLQSFVGWNTELNEAAVLVQGLLNITKEQSLLEDNIYLDRKAANQEIKQYRADYQQLNAEASVGQLDLKDKESKIAEVKADQLSIEKELQQLRSSGVPTRETKEEIEVLERRQVLLSKIQTQLESLFNIEQKEKKGGGSRKERFDLDYYLIIRDARLQELKDRKAFELAAAKSAEERNDIEIEYAKLVADVNAEAAETLGQIDASLYSNQISIIKTVEKWKELGKVTGEQAVKVYDTFTKGFVKDVADDIDTLGDQLKNGEISVEQYNAAVAASIQTNADVVRQSISSLVETGELTEQQASQLYASIDRVQSEIDPETKFAGKNSLLGRILGLDMTDIVADSAEAVVAEQTARIEAQIKEDLSNIIGEMTDIYGDFNETKYDNIKNEAEAEIDVIRERYRIEEEILKSSLNNQLITESQYRVKQQELKRAQLAEENAINRKIFESEKEQDRRLAIAEGAESAAMAVVNAYATGEPITSSIRAALSAAAIASGTALRIGAINQRQFFPKKFEDGGMVYGPSHAEGGVPFTVAGQGGYEMEGGEFIVNKRSASMHKDLLERINNSGRTSATQGKHVFANGGTVERMQGELSLELLKSIAETNASTAMNTGKPTRAFVSSKDLNKDRRERSIRERNNRV